MRTRGRRRSRRRSDIRLGGSVQIGARFANTLSRIVEPGEVGVSGRGAVPRRVVRSQRERQGILGGFALPPGKLLLVPAYTNAPSVRTKESVDANHGLNPTEPRDNAGDGVPYVIWHGDLRVRKFPRLHVEITLSLKFVCVAPRVFCVAPRVFCVATRVFEQGDRLEIVPLK